MTIAGEPAKITVQLDSRELYEQLKNTADENEMSVQDAVTEALQFWVDHQDLIEDTLGTEKIDRVALESSGEYIPHDEVKRRLRQ